MRAGFRPNEVSLTGVLSACAQAGAFENGKILHGFIGKISACVIVTLQKIKDQERFDGYYHNQFMVVNDCLHRYNFMAKWMFFFDVDEYIYVPKSTLKSVLNSLEGFNQFTIERRPMNGKTCLDSDYGKAHRKWGIEKLVYKDVKRGIRRDRKYAIQPRSAFTTGVHMSQNIAGKTMHRTEGNLYKVGGAPPSKHSWFRPWAYRLKIAMATKERDDSMDKPSP